jgi:hypothetical protein
MAKTAQIIYQSNLTIFENATEAITGGDLSNINEIATLISSIDLSNEHAPE